MGLAFKKLAETYRGRDVINTKAAEPPPPPTPHNGETTWRWLEDWMGIGAAKHAPDLVGGQNANCWRPGLNRIEIRFDSAVAYVAARIAERPEASPLPHWH